MIDPKRLAMMTRGVEELETWLLDILREGAASLMEAPADYWEDLAARMVDAKLSGVGRRIRAWPAISKLEEGPHLLLAEIADLYLFIQAFRRFEQLPADRQLDLLTTGGVKQKKELIRQHHKVVNDHWLVTGQIRGQEDNLKYRRTWLLGESTGQWALLLDYAWGRNDFSEEWITGSVFKGGLVFYPSNYPQRALIQSLEWSKRPFDRPPAFDEGDAMLREYARALADNPWLYTFPCLLEKCRVVNSTRNWLLVDQKGRQILLEIPETEPWELLALSAGNPIDVFGEWDGSHLLPLSVLNDQRLVPLTK